MQRGRKKKEETLKGVEKKFEDWRQHRKKQGPFPPALLASVDDLSKKIPFSTIAKALHINPTDIKKRIADSQKQTKTDGSPAKGWRAEPPLSFVEMTQDGIPPYSAPQSKETGVIECENPKGYKVRFYPSPNQTQLFQDWLKELFWYQK